VRSIRARLAIGLLAGLAVLLGAGGAALYYRTKAEIESQADATLASRAWALASALHADEGEIQFEPAPALAAEFERSDRWAGFEIRRKDGSLFARSPSLAGDEISFAAPIDDEPTPAWVESSDGRSLRRISLRVPVLNEVTPPKRSEESSSAGDSPERSVLDELAITVAEDRTQTLAMLAGLRTTILAVIASAFTMSLLLVHLVLRRGLAPLEAMASDVQRIDARSLEQRLSKDPMPAELETIRDRLNELLDRVQQSFERERRFNAAVAHELRTPIAELRALSEIALRWPERADAKRNMSDVSAVAREMQSVIEALLTLRRVESGAERVELEPVRVDELVRATIATYGKAAAAREQALRVNVATSMTIDSHPHMLHSIFSNLVSNAIEYAPKGSTIAIEARIQNERFLFSTKNPAPDLTPDDVLHLFEPFWRKDAARTTGSHAGLGLTLTESLAKAVGCSVHAELEPAGVLKIELESALAPVAPHDPPAGSAARSNSAKERVEIS
jgi:signal transduction histidine kinase